MRKLISGRIAPAMMMALPCAVALPAISAAAGPCGATVSARFTEASRICGAAPAAPVAAATPVVVETPGTVSIRMSSSARLRQAARVVNARGGAPTDGLVAAVARQYRINPHLLASMVHAESAGRQRAVSHKGALGLMQVMPATARSMGVRDPSRLLEDRALALSTGAAYLKHLQSQFGNNVPLVVAAYNAGPGAVKKYKGIPRYRETQGYVRKVVGRWQSATVGGGR
jgi:soluble lytic murein transglycosylase-like protein